MNHFYLLILTGQQVLKGFVAFYHCFSLVHRVTEIGAFQVSLA